MKEETCHPFLMGTSIQKSHNPTLSDKDVADRFLYRMIFFSYPLAYGTYSTKASMAS